MLRKFAVRVYDVEKGQEVKCRPRITSWPHLSAYLEQSTLHGLPDYVRPDTPPGLRLFWFIVLCLALTGATVHCYFVLRNALQNPTVTKVAYERLKDLSYPFVTVCDFTGSYFLDGEKLSRDNITTEIVKYMFASGPLWLLPLTHIPTKSILQDPRASSYYKKALEGNSNSTASVLSEFLLSYTLNCSQVFHSCRDSNWHRVDCCKIFRPIVHVRHGICFGFDAYADNAPYAKSAGLFSNFFVQFHRFRSWHFDDSLPWNLTTSPDDEESGDALEISLDIGIDQGVWRADALKLDDGEWVTIKMSARQILNEAVVDRRDCEADPQLDYFSHYTYANCMWERRLLKHDAFVARFPARHCALPILELAKLGVNLTGNSSRLPKDADFCTPEEIWDIVYNISLSGDVRHSPVAFKGITGWMSYLNISDVNPCPDPCNNWSFDYTVVQEPYSEMRDFAGITLTFSDPAYERVISVPALGWQDYLSLVGGSWGLWAGASFVTCIHIAVSFCRGVALR